ncbi:MAG: hypothetical protein M9893_10410 [Pyrinomonadaceae bacterium]|nr:hypothetical protein [Pyrinomonadaceae bacterium]
MIAAIRQRVSLIAVICLGILAQGGVVSAQDDGRPLIVIPGIIGSELVNRRTGEVVWPKVQRSKDDDLRLPITADPLKSRDDLIAGDIIRSIKIGIFPRIRGTFIKGLITTRSNRVPDIMRESWNDPTDKGAGKAIYVFPYDWRR